LFEINANRFASIIFSTKFVIAYLIWNANSLFISSKKTSTQCNYESKYTLEKIEGQSRMRNWQHWVHKTQDLS